MAANDVDITWKEGPPATHGTYTSMRFVKRRSGDDATQYLARGLADTVRRSHRFTSTIGVFVWQSHPNWVGRIDVRLLDAERDGVTLTVQEAWRPAKVHEWIVPPNGPYEPIAREIAALLPDHGAVPEFLIGSTAGGMAFHEAIEAARHWPRLFIFILFDQVFGAILATGGAIAGLVAASYLAPDGFPEALLGVLSVPLGWAAMPLFLTGLMIARQLAPPPSRAKRLRQQAPAAGGPVTQRPPPLKLSEQAITAVLFAVFLAVTVGLPILAVLAAAGYLAGGS